MLIPNCVCSGLYEAEFIWSLLHQPRIQRTILSVGIVLCLIVLGLSVWAGIRGDQVLFATIVLLAVMCIFYALGTYSYLLFTVGGHDVSIRYIFQAGCGCCFLLFVSTTILLPLILVGLCSGDIGLWILFSASSVCTVRFPLWAWQKKLNTLFGCPGQNKQHENFASTSVTVKHGNQRVPEIVGQGVESSCQDLERQNSTGPLIEEGRNERTGIESIPDNDLAEYYCCSCDKWEEFADDKTCRVCTHRSCTHCLTERGA